MNKLLLIALLFSFMSYTAVAKNSTNKSINVEDTIKRYHVKYCDDLNAVFENFTTLAKSNNASAKAYLSFFNLTGECNVKRNKTLGLQLFDESFSEDNPHALYLEGMKHKHGFGVYKIDIKKAMEFYKRSSDLGFTTAQYYLAELYWNKYDNKDIRTDREKAIALYRAAADKGNAEAQYKMGDLYINGFPLPEYKPDYAKAFQYYEKSANQGHKEASFSLAQIHARGYRITRDLKEAVKLVEAGYFNHNENKIGYIPGEEKVKYKLWKEMINCEKTAKTTSFGIKLRCAKRNELRQAIKSFGGRVVSENDKHWGDTYNPSEFLSEATSLKVMYSTDNHFSSMFYTIDKKNKDAVYNKLSKKYGEGECIAICEWYLEDGIAIWLANEYPDKVKLTYKNVLFESSEGFSSRLNKRVKNHSNRVAEYKKSKLSNQAL